VNGRNGVRLTQSLVSKSVGSEGEGGLGREGRTGSLGKSDHRASRISAVETQRSATAGWKSRFL
jgi:hypothetical protein